MKLDRYDKEHLEGLSPEEVNIRIQQHLTNNTESNSKSVFKILFVNLFTFFNFVFAALAVWLVYVEAYEDLIFLVVVTINVIIGVYQEIKAKRTVDKLAILNTPTAIVVRDKVKESIPSKQVVLDDIIILSAGNQIPADSILKSGSIEVNESLLTGESDLIKKKKGDLLLAGSFVVSGTCYARVDACGRDTYVSKLTKAGKALGEPQSEILNALKYLIRVVTLIIIPIGYFGYRINSGNISMDFTNQDAVVKTVASIVGIIPAGLYLTTTVALSASSRRLANQNALVQDIYSIEMLARINTLCLDKTGTITDGTMSVEKFLPIKKSDKYQKIISSINYALQERNETGNALREYFGDETHYEEVNILPFSSARKYSAVKFKRIGTYVIGAPEFVLKMNSDLKKEVNFYAAKGKRVLVLAKAEGLNEKGFEGSTSLESLIIIEDHIRDDARVTIEYFNANSVDVKVISGDNPITVAEIARKAGVQNSQNYISLEGLSDEEVIESAKSYTIFGRVIPEQKKLLVETFQKEGRKVAMTGDGVNDILALKQADVSIAMASGSDAARSASQLVLMDSNFSSMPKILKEGRRVINNIEKVASLYLMKNVYILLIVVLTFITGKPYPFRPIQMVLIEFFVIGLPGFMLAVEENSDLVSGKFIPKALKKSLPGSIVVFLSIAILFATQNILHLGDDEVSTISLVVALVTSLIMLGIFCQPFTKYRRLVFSSMLISSAFALFYLSESFHVYWYTVSTSGYLMMIILIQFAVPILLNLRKIKENTEVIIHAGERLLERIDELNEVI